MTKALFQRRSNRRHWRIFERVAIVILDAILIYVSFRLAHYFRYYVLSNSPVLVHFRNSLLGIENNGPLHGSNPPFKLTQLDDFRPLEIGVVVGLMVIFALRGLYSIRLTGSWVRQVWNIIS